MQNAYAWAAFRPRQAAALQNALSGQSLTLHCQNNIRAPMIANAFKNVLALMSGILRGESAAQNTLNSFLALGFAEMCRFGAHWGLTSKDFLAPALLGDFMLTTQSSDSRHTKAGIAIGSGKTPSTDMLAEGVDTLSGILKRAECEASIFRCAEQSSGDSLTLRPSRSSFPAYYLICYSKESLFGNLTCTASTSFCPFSLILMLIVATGFFIIRQQTLGIVERLGRFHRVAGTGLRFAFPSSISAARLNLKFSSSTLKSKQKPDDVFIHLWCRFNIT